MPGFNQTGPQGQGPRTGRGLGYCASTAEGRQGIGYGVGRGGIPYGGGRGLAFGGRRGRGGRRGMWAPAPPVHMTDAQEIVALREQAALLQEELAQITARLDTLTDREQGQE